MGDTLHARGVTFGYPGQDPVLSDVDLTVTGPEKIGVIGPNGAGKTTLFMLVCGVLAPVSGELTVFGAPVRPGEFQPQVGMVFHHTQDQLFCPSVREDVAFGPQNMGLTDSEVAQRVEQVAASTGITPLLDRPPHELSSGEQRLVALTGILAMMPRMMIFDEPTSDLDLRYRRRLIRMIADMTDHTLLMASHDLEFILETCDRVLLVDEGRIQADGAPAAIMADAQLMEAHGLEVPHSLVARWHRHPPAEACEEDGAAATSGLGT